MGYISYVYALLLWYKILVPEAGISGIDKLLQLTEYCEMRLDFFAWNTLDWFNIKMSSYQYKKPHCEDKTILRPSYLHNGISYTGKMSLLYWIMAQLLAAKFSYMGLGNSFHLSMNTLRIIPPLTLFTTSSDCFLFSSIMANQLFPISRDLQAIKTTPSLFNIIDSDYVYH